MVIVRDHREEAERRFREGWNLTTKAPRLPPMLRAVLLPRSRGRQHRQGRGLRQPTPRQRRRPPRTPALGRRRANRVGGAAAALAQPQLHRVVGGRQRRALPAQRQRTTPIATMEVTGKKATRAPAAGFSKAPATRELPPPALAVSDELTAATATMLRKPAAAQATLATGLGRARRQRTQTPPAMHPQRMVLASQRMPAAIRRRLRLRALPKRYVAARLPRQVVRAHAPDRVEL